MGFPVMERQRLASREVVFPFSSNSLRFRLPFSPPGLLPTTAPPLRPRPCYSGKIHAICLPFRSHPGCPCLLCPADPRLTLSRGSSLKHSLVLEPCDQGHRRPLDFGGVPQIILIALHPEFEERGINSLAISQHSQGASPMRLIQFPLSAPKTGGICPGQGSLPAGRCLRTVKVALLRVGRGRGAQPLGGFEEPAAGSGYQPTDTRKLPDHACSQVTRRNGRAASKGLRPESGSFVHQSSLLVTLGLDT